jgi:hypothetical protein
MQLFMTRLCTTTVPVGVTTMNSMISNSTSLSGFTLTRWGVLLHQRMENKNPQHPTCTPRLRTPHLDHPNLQTQLVQIPSPTQIPTLTPVTALALPHSWPRSISSTSSTLAPACQHTYSTYHIMSIFLLR